jgi:hypothetical protein
MRRHAEGNINYDTVLKIIRGWPVSQRVTLVQAVLSTLVPPPNALAPRAPTLTRARGLLATAQPAPSDEQISQWLEERRQERYGL